MPTYTDPTTGKRIKSATPLTDAELEEAFGGAKKTGPPPRMKNVPTTDGNNPVQDLLEGAGLPKNADELGQRMDESNTALEHPGTPQLNMLAAMLNDVKGRVARYYGKQADENTPLNAAQTILAGVPGVGNVMEAMDRGIPRSGPLNTHEITKGAGAALATMAPFSGEVNLPKFEMPDVNVGRLAGMAKDAAVAGITNTKVLGSKMNLRGAINDYKAAQSLRTPMEADVIPEDTSVDPRAAELKDLVLNRKLAAEKGQLPTTEAAKLNTPMNAEPLIEMNPLPSDPRVAELKDLVLKRRLLQEKGQLPSWNASTINPGDVEELKRLKLQKSLEKLRGDDTNPSAEVDPTEDGNSSSNTDTTTPTAKFKSKLDAVAPLPKKNTSKRFAKTPPPATKEVPTAPNPASKIVPHDPVAAIDDTENPDVGNYSTLSDDEMLTSPAETKQMREDAKVRELLPETTQEWEAVNNLQEAGMNRIDAMKEIRRQKLAKAAAAGDPLNSRAAGTNPRAIGTDRRTRNVNPRALDNKRREP